MNTADLLAKKEQLIVLQEQCREHHEKATQLSNQIRTLQQEVSEAQLADIFRDGITFPKVMELSWSLVDYSTKWYHQLSNWINSHPVIYQSGYYPETDQVAIKIKLDSQQPLKDQLSILEVIPHLKILPRHDHLARLGLSPGCAHIGIFEQTLSQYGSYFLELERLAAYDTWELGKYEVRLVRQTYGRPTVLATFTEPMAALEYIHRHHPYS